MQGLSPVNPGSPARTVVDVVYVADGDGGTRPALMGIMVEGCSRLNALQVAGKLLYQARESSLVPLYLLTVHFLQKMYIYEAFVIV